MIMDKIKIVFVTPYSTLTQDIEEAFSVLNRSDVEYEIIKIQKDVREILDKLEGDVVIARGFAYRYFTKMKPKDMISVEITSTEFEQVLAVKECIEKYQVNHIAVMGTKSLIYSPYNLNNFFEGVQLDYYYMDSWKEIMNKVDVALEQGAQAIVGGETAYHVASEKSIPAVIIKTSSEAIMKAQEMAIRLVETTRKERAERDRISKIMDYSYGGIISTDGEGIIRSINRKACKILKVSESDCMGKPFHDFLEEPDIPELLRKNERLLDEICKKGNTLLTINCIPVKDGQANIGAVITCNEASVLQKTEAKLRRKIMEKGFVAKYSFENIIFCDGNMKQAVEKAQRFSRHESNVFIGGETGVGKELIAQSIHNASHRNKGPFVAVNCAALPESLLESELFGYVEGAFTGASKGGKMGLFEAAHGGTIFLDEIGDLSLKLQGRLLRVLQEREIVRLGDDHVIPIDIRVISATNKKLMREVEAGTFRDDLMYRLEVLKISIPPLRQRKKDIIPLLRTFVREVCEQERKPVFKEIEDEGKRILENYSWSGNVRQLRNIAQRICVLCDGEVISKEVVREALEINMEREVPSSGKSKVVKGLGLSERDMVLNALKDNEFNRNEAARQLGIDRTTLWRRMKKYDLL